MRLAITIGQKHNGDWEVIARPDVPIHEQLEARRGLMAERTHPTYQRVYITDLDHAQVIRFREPEKKAEPAKAKK
jgi:hypothetical protein